MSQSRLDPSRSSGSGLREELGQRKMFPHPGPHGPLRCSPGEKRFEFTDLEFANLE